MLDAPANGAVLGATVVVVTGRVSDDVDVVFAAGLPAVLGQAENGWRSWTSQSVALDDGAVTVVVEATDRADQTTTLELHYGLDTAPPSVSIEQPRPPPAAAWSPASR